MLDPFFNMRKYLTWTFILIIFLLITGIAVAKDYKKIIPINPDDVGGQYCFITVTIKTVGDEVIKEEIGESEEGEVLFGSADVIVNNLTILMLQYTNSELPKKEIDEIIDLLTEQEGAMH